MFRKNQNPGGADPHEILPDVLFWEKGDVLYWGKLELITSEGIVFMSNGSKLRKEKLSKIAQLYGRDYKEFNESLTQRRLKDDLEHSKTDYLQYIEDFNKAYREIKGDF